VDVNLIVLSADEKQISIKSLAFACIKNTLVIAPIEFASRIVLSKFEPEMFVPFNFAQTSTISEPDVVFDIFAVYATSYVPLYWN